MGNTGARGYRDLHEHLDALDKAGLLLTIDKPVNKDTIMHPLVRWQFRGGIPEAERKAFLFTNIVDSRGRSYDIPVVIGALAASQDIYRIGMGVPLADIAAKWDHAIANPVPPCRVDAAPCHEVVIAGEAQCDSCSDRCCLCTRGRKKYMLRGINRNSAKFGKRYSSVS